MNVNEKRRPKWLRHRLSIGRPGVQRRAKVRLSCRRARFQIPLERRTQTGLSPTCHGIFSNHLDMSRWCHGEVSGTGSRRNGIWALYTMLSKAQLHCSNERGTSAKAATVRRGHWRQKISRRSTKAVQGQTQGVSQQVQYRYRYAYLHSPVDFRTSTESEAVIGGITLQWRHYAFWRKLRNVNKKLFVSVILTMDYSTELPPGYVYATVKSDLEDTTCLRCNITSSSEWYSWLSKFEDMSSQKFVVKRTYHEPVRCVYRNVIDRGLGKMRKCGIWKQNAE